MTQSGSIGKSVKLGRMPRSKWLLLAVLAIVQFVHILDFVIVMPLGPQLMRAFKISAREFGWIVSSYTFAAAVSGLVAAFFLDRFDRRNVLVTLLAGFAVGTGLCAIAPTYMTLVMARVFAGAFGGVLAAVVFAIVGDQFPQERRGTAMGVVMSGFSAASVLGLPFGLTLANRSGWHAPFLMLAGLSVAILLLAWMVLPPMREHLGAARTRSPLAEVRDVLRPREHLGALALTATLVFGGFSVIPYISPFLVGNVGVTEAELAYVYLVGGAFTLFTGPLTGRLADRFGTLPVFGWAALLSAIPIVALTNLPPVSLAAALVVTTVFMILVSGRMIVATTIVTNTVQPAQRGSFMAINSSVQQMAAGVASALAGMVIGTGAGGEVTRYGWVGVLAVVATGVALWIARRLARDYRARPLAATCSAKAASTAPRKPSMSSGLVR